MNQSKISVRYAKALFLAARDMQVLDAVYQDMSLVRQLFSDLPELSTILENPVITPKQKRALFEQTFKKYVQPLSYRFFQLLLKNNREIFLPDITRVFADYYKKEKGITHAALHSAVKIRRDLKEKLTRLLKHQLKSDIQFSEIVDPELIGGFILTVEDEQYDASIRHQLQNIRQELSK
ncbi:MAG: ATP synthase F1 subunit delta [Chlorobi bacterium]|nr:ATP synthase F1 subunit delta [Chlorobiota bacterium]